MKNFIFVWSIVGCFSTAVWSMNSTVVETDVHLDNSTSSENLASCIDCAGTPYCTHPWGCHCLSNGGERTPCAYTQKKQSVAFGLSLPLGFTGADRYYVGTMREAVAKTVLLATSISTAITAYVIAKSSSSNERIEQRKGCVAGMSFLICQSSASAIFFWWIIDAVYFGQNRIKDGNSIELIPW